MRYIGCKTKLLDFLDTAVESCENAKIIFDCCAGTGSVTTHFSEQGYTLKSNDLMYFSHILCKGKNTPQKIVESAAKIIEELNNTNGTKKGFIYNNYSKHGGRLYFTENNAQRIDYLMEYIESIACDDTRMYLKYCLLEAVSKVANITGVYAAYLKSISSNAANELKLKPEYTFYKEGNEYFNSDILDIVQDVECDILYIDPPYNGRQYGSNYHLLETIALNDSPEIRGKTGLRETKKSSFCSKREIYNFLKTIVVQTHAKYILISYNSEGILTRDQFEDIGREYSSYEVFEKEYKRYKSNTNSEQQASVVEYIFKITK